MTSLTPAILIDFPLDAQFVAAAFLKHPRTPTSAPGIDYQSADSEHLMKRMRVGQPDEVFG
jgi:hypothetical protein